MTNKRYSKLLIPRITLHFHEFYVKKYLYNGLNCAPETEILIDQDSEDSHEKISRKH